LLSASGCVNKSIPFETLAEGDQSLVNTESFIIINDQDQFLDVWKSLSYQSGPPTIDFSKKTVIAVFMGTQGSTGYEIGIDKIIEYDDRIEVRVSYHSPSDFELTVLTSPFHIVLTEKLTKPVSFKIEY